MSSSYLHLRSARATVLEQEVSDLFEGFDHLDMSKEQELNRVELLLLNESLYFRFTE